MSIRFRAVATILAAALMAATLVALPAIIPCALSGCAEVRHQAAKAPTQAPAEQPAPAPTSVADADQRIAEAQGRADAAARDLAALRADRDRLVEDQARARLAWTAGLLQLAVIGFAALAIFSPVGRTWAVTASCAAEGAAVLALALREVYHYLPVAGCVVGVAFVALAAWHIRKAVRAARAAADHGDRMEAALLGIRDWFTGDESLLHDLVASVKVESAKAQKAAGVGGVLARIRGADPAHSAAMAALPVIRAKVAELPARVIPEPQPHDAPTQRIDLAPLIAKGDAPPPTEPPKAA